MGIKSAGVCVVKLKLAKGLQSRSPAWSETHEVKVEVEDGEAWSETHNVNVKDNVNVNDNVNGNVKVN